MRNEADIVYLDNAATSWPKPVEVVDAMASYMRDAGGNPGRSGHRLSRDAGRIVYRARESVARLFGVPDPLRVVFTLNATHALNIALFGVLRPGDRVVTTSVEHNSIMRPLRCLEKNGVELRIVQCDRSGHIDLDDWSHALADGARMAVAVHASNVTGRIFPVADLAKLAHRAGALFLTDAAQTAGVEPIDINEMKIDMLAFTGHKGMMGPQGVGGLVISDWVDANQISPLMHGGTGSASASEEQPDMLPDKFECGTPNGVGIAGLGAGVDWILNLGIDKIRRHHNEMMTMLISGLAGIPGVTIYGPESQEQRAGLVSFRVEGHQNAEVGLVLDEEYGIMCRTGLHCAPAAHKTIGTFPEGTVRFGIGPMTTTDEIERSLSAVREIARR